MSNTINAYINPLIFIYSMLEEFLGKGQYFSFGPILQGPPEGLKKIKRIHQDVRIKCGVETCLAIDKLVKYPEIINDIIGGSFDFSKRVTTEKGFHKILSNLIRSNYVWDNMGSTSRPLNLKVDPNSLKLGIIDILRISSEKEEGNYTLKAFDVKFDLLGIVQFGGFVGDGEYDALRAWALKKIPVNDSDSPDY